ncbi:hypothetical protein KHC23_11320 [Ancylobacter dichloromethanicus]|uniref:Uncharacterized protein n=1 Tax=Ancylobacter dichloromethanicus TaxID=518825 RepID=A0A9W6J6N9_9HYPH|nr:hypothetical protein [Ancylobacter dichloromethanicus]MBS7554240.1 hypothetical protein [Ancylobacter dichloromethanicus]GLK71362.1 hypothetical protein GCM10017643_14770 [Ancylobacter dichloromethanicus]
MLVELFWVALVAGVSAAAVIWVLAARLAFGMRRVAGGGALALLPALLWPFGTRQLAGASPSEATRLNKMMVAFFAALLIAIASMAVYSNLTFVLPAPTQ